MKTKKLFLSFFVLFLMVSPLLKAQVRYTIGENSEQKIGVSFSFEMDNKNIDVITKQGIFSRIFIEGCVGSKLIGEPELPVSVHTLKIPFCRDFLLNVSGNDFEEYDVNTLGIYYPIYPAQPSVSKSYTGEVEFIQNKNIYQTDAYYELPLAHFEIGGVMRNVKLGHLYVSPVQYNPVTHKIKIYKSIDVQIVFKDVDITKTQIMKELHKTPLFQPSNIINSPQNEKNQFSKTPIKYLIIAHSMFRGELDELINWKKRKGFLVEIGYTDDVNVGTTRESIANYIKSFYVHATIETPAPTFVLLVGDVQQIPVFDWSHGSYPTDLYYFTWEGGNIPCCFYGRFSANNITQLAPQIRKTLQYEQFTMPDTNYLDDIVLIAGFDNTYSPVYANGFLNYISQNYATITYGYKNIYTHYHPKSSEPVQAQLIKAEIGAGVGMANYTAHCTTSGWDNPSFRSSDIQQMKNMNKYGLMIGNCCQSGRFVVDECFGEALLRASEKGAVGYIGAADDTYWEEDYFWGIGCRNLEEISPNPSYDPTRLGAYDRLFHTHGETNEKWMTTFGSMIVAGNEAVNNSTSYLKKQYWEIYNLLGDPSLMPYLTKPSSMNVKNSNKIEIGATSFSATVVPFSYCALTNSKLELVSAGFADADGNITLIFDSIPSGYYEFAVWAQNHVQYFKTIKCGGNSIDENIITCYIYPNPTSGELQVTNDGLRITGVEIFDMMGKKQKSRRAEEQNVEGEIGLDISDLNAGIYFLKIATEKGMITKKIVKL